MFETEENLIERIDAIKQKLGEWNDRRYY
jgi:hypothetical protein